MNPTEAVVRCCQDVVIDLDQPKRSFDMEKLGKSLMEKGEIERRLQRRLRKRRGIPSSGRKAARETRMMPGIAELAHCSHNRGGLSIFHNTI
jgi:hypothetical protein